MCVRCDVGSSFLSAFGCLESFFVDDVQPKSMSLSAAQHALGLPMLALLLWS